MKNSTPETIKAAEAAHAARVATRKAKVIAEITALRPGLHKERLAAQASMAALTHILSTLKEADRLTAAYTA